jgi:hypothetical protein
MQVMKSLSLAMLAAVVLALACFASAADTPLPDYSSAFCFARFLKGITWVPFGNMYHVTSIAGRGLKHGARGHAHFGNFC